MGHRRIHHHHLSRLCLDRIVQKRGRAQSRVVRLVRGEDRDEAIILVGCVPQRPRAKVRAGTAIQLYGDLTIPAPIQRVPLVRFDAGLSQPRLPFVAPMLDRRLQVVMRSPKLVDLQCAGMRAGLKGTTAVLKVSDLSWSRHEQKTWAVCTPGVA